MWASEARVPHTGSHDESVTHLSDDALRPHPGRPRAPGRAHRRRARRGDLRGRPGRGAQRRRRRRDPAGVAGAPRRVLPGPVPRTRRVPGVRPPHRRAGRVPVREGLRRPPRDHRRHQAPARDGELRRDLAQRHRVPRAAADGDHAARARGAARGGDTMFANMYTAYETLSPGMRRLLTGMRAVNSSALADVSKTREDRIRENGNDDEQQYLSEHPVVRTHPETGRPALYVNPAHTASFADMTEAESRPLLEYLFAHSTRPELTCRFRWEVGSLALWDNRCAMHNPINDYHGYTRVHAPDHARRRPAALTGPYPCVDGARPERAECRRDRRRAVPAQRGQRLDRGALRGPLVHVAGARAESLRRAALWAELRDPTAPPHIGVLLDNTAEYLFWLGAAALTRSVIVGINATYRGAELAQLVDYTDCQAARHVRRLRRAARRRRRARVPADRVLTPAPTRTPELLAGVDAEIDARAAEPDDLYLLIFTSGSTGFPKAVRCTQGRFAAHGHAREDASPSSDRARRSTRRCRSSTRARCSPGWPSALQAEVPFGSRARFSASNTMPDIRRIGRHDARVHGEGPELHPRGAAVTRRRVVAADVRVRQRGVGGATSASSRAGFDCAVRDSYGSTEGLIIIRRDAIDAARRARQCRRQHPRVRPRHRRGVPACRVRHVPGGCSNAEAAVGEIVNVAPGETFEGYYRNEEANVSKVRDGIYWSGDLAYRDADGWFFFAGRSNEWLRVDGENFAAAPVERIVLRAPGCALGGRVRGARRPGRRPRDGGGRGRRRCCVRPRRVRRVRGRRNPTSGPSGCRASCGSTPELPKLASMKIDKTRLRREGWDAPAVSWRPAKGEALRPMTPADVEALAPLRSTT